jgi:hypothetical protein
LIFLRRLAGKFATGNQNKAEQQIDPLTPLWEMAPLSKSE